MSVPSTDEVTVTVTTTRVEQEDGVRAASATGTLDVAVREALQARLAPWAVDQVLGRVLARRPQSGMAAEYEGSFSPERHIRVHIAPAGQGEQSPPCRRRGLAGLFMPDEAQPPAFEEDRRR